MASILKMFFLRLNSVFSLTSQHPWLHFNLYHPNIDYHKHEFAAICLAFTQKTCKVYFLTICSLTASLMREGSYSTIRLGAYEPMKKMFGATDPAHTPLWKKICAGGISGEFHKRTCKMCVVGITCEFHRKTSKICVGSISGEFHRMTSKICAGGISGEFHRCKWRSVLVASSLVSSIDVKEDHAGCIISGEFHWCKGRSVLVASPLVSSIDVKEDHAGCIISGEFHWCKGRSCWSHHLWWVLSPTST